MAQVDPLIGMTIHFDPPPPGRDPSDAPRGGQGSQVLPVAELDDDFEGEPEDGMEYLFLVRREAFEHRAGTRADFADEWEDEVTVARASTSAPAAPSNRPSESWRQSFLAQVVTLRRRMASAPHRRDFPLSSQVQFPPARDESGWKLFINGRHLPPTIASAPLTAEQLLAEAKAAALASLDLDSDEEQPAPAPPPPETATLPPAYDPKYPPHLPTPAMMIQMEQNVMMCLLGHFTEWFVERQESYEQASHEDEPRPRPPLPSAHELNWILSILSKLHELQEGDDISSLRTLARSVTGMIEESEAALVAWRASGAKAGDATEVERLADEEDAEGRAKGWMVVAVIAGVWKQEDLWNSNL